MVASPRNCYDAGVTPSAPENSIKRDLLLLGTLCALLFMFGLGSTPLANPDESRYAEIPREMLQHSDYVTPRLNEVVYFEKPPLTYWCVAGSMAVFGQNEFAARLPVALFGTLGVLSAFVLGWRLGGARAGWFSGLILATSLLYFALSRVLLTDMIVAALITTTLTCFLLGVREAPGRKRRLLFYGLYASAAGATLAKGLIGVLLPGAVMFLWLLVYNQWRRLRPFYLPTGALLFLAIAAPWHLLVAQRNPQWAQFYFVHEHFERFTTTTHRRGAPWWFFLPIVPAAMFPWSGILWPALRQAWPASWRLRGERADAGFLIVWAGFILFFFSLSQSKLVPYILPVLPPLAVLGGLALSSEIGQAAAKFTVRIFMVLASLLGLALLTVAAKPQFLAKLEHGEPLRHFALVMGIIMLIGAVGCFLFLRRNLLQTARWLMVFSSCAFFAALVLASPALARSSTRDLARVFLQEAQPSDRVFHYREYFHDFTFYAKRPVDVVNGIGELEVDLDPVAPHSGRFLSEEEFARIWRASEQIYVVARADAASEWLSAPGHRGYVLARSHGHVLFTNRTAP